MVRRFDVRVTIHDNKDDSTRPLLLLPPSPTLHLLRRLLLGFSERHDFHKHRLLFDAQRSRRSLIQRWNLVLES